jgi:hypothetical protein
MAATSAATTGLTHLPSDMQFRCELIEVLTRSWV